jgi:hypothetical protein
MNNFFDHIYCYNLPDQKERLKSVLSQSEKLSLEIEIFESVDRRGEEWIEPMCPSHKGINDTVSRIIKDARSRGFVKILVLQDDVIFRNTEDFKVENIPESWDFLSLGCLSLSSPIKFKGNICKSDYPILDHAIGFNLENGKLFDDYIKRLNAYEAESDVIIANMAKEKECNYYMVIPYIATQGRFFSSYTNKMENAKECN